jgi:excisionase family DNA binding protein
MTATTHSPQKQLPTSVSNDWIGLAVEGLLATLSPGLVKAVRGKVENKETRAVVTKTLQAALPSLLENSLREELTQIRSRVALLHLLAHSELELMPSKIAGLSNVEETIDDLTSEAAAKMLGVSRTHLNSLVEKGELSASRTQGGHRRFAEAEIAKYKVQMKQRQSEGLDKMLESSTMLGLYDDELEGIPTRGKRPK